MEEPLISIIMPCYNGQAFLAEAIESVLGQTLRGFELIVVDDGSTDGSAEILRGYGDRIRVVRQSNKGVSAARNVGMRESAGEFIAFLDTDDYWHREFLQHMVAGMENPATAIAYCGWQNVGVTPGNPFVPPDYEAGDKMHHLLRFASLWPIHAILIRRTALPPGVPFNPEYPACEDYDLWLRVASFHRIQLVPKVLAFYRKHSTEQATSNQARVARYNLLVKKRFLAEFPELMRGATRARRRAILAGGVVDRGYRCLWKGDLASAHGIFRHALVNGVIGLKDLKYAVPSLLPYGVYAWLARGWRRQASG